MKKIKISFSILVFCIILFIAKNVNAQDFFSVYDYNKDKEYYDVADYKFDEKGKGKGVEVEYVKNSEEYLDLSEAEGGAIKVYDQKINIYVLDPQNLDNVYIDLSIRRVMRGVKKEGKKFKNNYDTYLGDDESKKEKATTDASINTSCEKGYKINFTNFNCEILRTYESDEVAKKYGFVETRLKPAIIDPDVDKEYNMYVRGRYKTVLLGKFIYKVQELFERKIQKESNLAKFKNVNEGTNWDSSLSTIIENYGFEIDKKEINGLSDSNTDLAGISTKRVKNCGDKNSVFEVTATKDGTVNEYGAVAKKVKIVKGKKYKITLSNIWYLVTEKTMYCALSIDDVEDKSDDSHVEDNINSTDKGTKETLKKLASKVDATARNETTFNDIFDDISYYTPGTQNVSTTVTNKASKVLTIITNVGIVLSVIMVAIMGIKYMLGSVEEKADYKKDMIPYLVGSCLLFGILTIVKILQQIGESINNI